MRIGVGVRLPRTPKVFDRKRHWKLPGQKDPEAHLRDDFISKTAKNYPSVQAFAREVEDELALQVKKGQIEVVTEEEAKTKYGDRLATASLGALEKCRRADGSVEIRIIHDGTHQVGINDQIRVRDAGACPTAADLATALRHMEFAGIPCFSIKMEAHRAVAVDPVDWGLQACQLGERGPVFLNRRGTYGISSAAYWWGGWAQRFSV